MLQVRLAGQSLWRLWGELTLGQKKSAVRQLCQITLDLAKITHDRGGKISTRNSSLDLSETAKLDVMDVPPLREHFCDFIERGKICPAEPETTLEFVRKYCERWRGFDWPYKPDDAVWDGFIRMAEKMHELGLLPDDERFHFAHGDLFLRNILAEVDGVRQVRITGILDWDDAKFVPKFVAYRAPFFLWSPSEHDERLADARPVDFEQAVYKRMFEELVGPEFLRYAYGPEYILARRMLRFLLDGVVCGPDERCAWEIIEEFEKMHPTSG